MKKVQGKYIKVDKSIFYNEENDSYYVHFNFSGLGDSTQSFPTLELAIKYRNAVQEETAKLKILKAKEKLYKEEEKIINSRDVYPENVLGIATIDNSMYAPEILERFEEILKEFTPREQEIIALRYQQYKTFEEIGKVYGVTRERVRQILTKAIIKIRYKFTHFVEKIEFEKFEKQEQEFYQKSYDDLVAKRQELIELFKQNGEYTEEMEIYFGEVFPKSAVKVRYEDLDIEELDLSVRSYNCLRRVGIKKIGDLLKLSYPYDYWKIRNLGKKSLKEIVDKLKEHGLNIEEEANNGN